MSPATLRHRSIALAVVGASLLIASCGSDGPDVYTAPTDGRGSIAPAATTPEGPAADDPASDVSVPPNGETVDVRALDNSFIDEVVEVTAGTEVRWENRGRNDHDVVPVDEGEDWGVELEDFTSGDSYAHVFTTPGTYRYYCTIHGTADVGMVGTIVVT